MTIAALRHLTLIAGLLAAAAVLPGCSSGGFDVDKLDIFGLGDKPKLPGERKAVFPEGVPGVTQGIPPDLIKGNQPQTDTLNSQTAAAPVAPVTVEETEPKPKAKPRPKPRTTARTAPARQPAAAETGQEQATQRPSASQSSASQPSASQTSASGTQAPWPSSTPQATGTNSPWPASPNTTTAPWPSAPPPGTFSR
ncbi:MAG: hypothetical protein AB7O50_09155 [Pseudolabrys sp.]